MAELKKNIETVNFLKKKLDDGVSYDKTLHILLKLQKVPISIKLLEATGIGLKIRNLSKTEKNNDIGKKAKFLVMTWKNFVCNQLANDNDDNKNNNDTVVNQNESFEKAETLYDFVKQSPSSLKHPKLNFDSLKSKNFKKKEKNEAIDTTDKTAVDFSDTVAGTISNILSRKEQQKAANKQEKHWQSCKKNQKSQESFSSSQKNEQTSTSKPDSSKHTQSNKPIFLPSTETFFSCNSSLQNNQNYLSDQHHNSSFSLSLQTSNASTTATTTSSCFSFKNCLNNQSLLSSSKTSQTLATLDSINKKESTFGLEPNYRPSMHRRLDKLIEQAALAKSKALSFSLPPTIHHQNTTAADALKRAHTAGMKLFKNQTAVWSGVSKMVTVAKMYSLQEFCIRLLMNHLDMVFNVGDLPYDLLKPVLKKCSVLQLRRIEYYNPQFIDKSDKLWNEFVQEEFKTFLKPAKFTSWRQYYDYQVETREHRLKAITAGISSKTEKAVPKRKTVMIDVKQPQKISRRQKRTLIPFNNSSGANGKTSFRQDQDDSLNCLSSNFNKKLKSPALHSINFSSSTLGTMANMRTKKPKTTPLMKKLLKIRKNK